MSNYCTVLTPTPTFEEMVSWIAAQTCSPDVELSDAEIERLLRVDEWLLDVERMACCADGVTL